MSHHCGRAEQKRECVLHHRNWVGRRVVASTWKGRVNERVCVALLMQHYGTGRVDEMLHQHGWAELSRWARCCITMEGWSKRASVCCIIDATLWNWEGR